MIATKGLPPTCRDQARYAFLDRENSRRKVTFAQGNFPDFIIHMCIDNTNRIIGNELSSSTHYRPLSREEYVVCAILELLNISKLPKMAILNAVKTCLGLESSFHKT